VLWLITGLVIGAGMFWLGAWTRAHKLSVAWYEWLITIVAIILALLAIQNFESSLAELEARAAWIMLAMFGVPAITLAAIAALLVWRRQRPAKAAPQET
jgi:hypothetical protein